MLHENSSSTTSYHLNMGSNKRKLSDPDSLQQHRNTKPHLNQAESRTDSEQYTINPLESRAALESTVTYGVYNILSRIEAFPESDDLRRWSPNSRRDLRILGDISLVIQLQATRSSTAIYRAPKLAPLVASPTLRRLILQEPHVEEIELQYPGLEPSAIGILCYWLGSICKWNAQATPLLPCPSNTTQLLALRHAAQVLCMDKYVRSFEIRYLLAVHQRLPSIGEAFLISKYTMDAGGPILDAWANRVGHLRRSNALLPAYIRGMAELFATKKHRKLLEALAAADVDFQGQRECQAEVYSHHDNLINDMPSLPSTVCAVYAQPHHVT